MPFPVAAAIGAGALVGSGIIGSEAAKSQTKDQLAYQREFAKHGIRWRVEDAKAAGVHPLLAMGAQVPSYQPVVIDDPLPRALGEAGQTIARSVAATSTPEEKQMTQLALQSAQARVRSDNAMADYYSSLAARTRQEANSAQTFPLETGLPGLDGQGLSWLGDYPEGFLSSDSGRGLDSPLSGRFVEKAPTVSSHAVGQPHVSSGTKPGWDNYNLGPGLDIQLPTSSNMGEALEPISESPRLLVPIIVGHNVEQYGPQWLTRMWDLYTSGYKAVGGKMGNDFESWLSNLLSTKE